jgi:LysR family hydrogen peroxide-inducible transcriptional activator
MSFAPHPFTLRQLQYVLAVAERRSFRKAAEACHVAQPSLSAQIAQVEQALGVQLFERDTRGVALTAAGRVVIERARALLLASDDLVESARVLADPFAGTLRIGLIPTIGPYLLPEVAPVLRARYQKLSFVWAEEKTATLIDLLARGELDAAILALEAEVGDLPRVVLGKDPFVFAAPKSHPLASGKRPLKATELDGERVLFLDDGHCFRDQALAFCSRTGAEEAGYRATSLLTLVQMAAGGAGVTLLPSLALGVENRHQELSVRAFAPQAPFRTVAFVWRRGAALEMTLKAIGDALAGAYAAIEKRAIRIGANASQK